MASVTYECRGHLVSPPKGRKKANWGDFTKIWGKKANAPMSGKD